MAVEKTRLYTVEEFEALTHLQENYDKRFELINGELVELPSNAYSSEIASMLNRWIGNHVFEHKLGRVTGENGGYIVAGQRLAPDVAFISKERQRQLARQGYNPVAPDLAVEVMSPSDTEEVLQKKLLIYQEAGTTVWVMRPKTEQVDVHIPGQPMQTLRGDDILDGGAILPGFQLRVRDIFADPLADDEVK